jgi:hypothetical protein
MTQGNRVHKGQAVVISRPQALVVRRQRTGAFRFECLPEGPMPTGIALEQFWVVESFLDRVLDVPG